MAPQGICTFMTAENPAAKHNTLTINDMIKQELQWILHFCQMFVINGFYCDGE